MFEREYRELSFVPRWSVARVLRQQSVAEHCYYVALYAQQTSLLIAWRAEAPFLLMQHALTHDLMEVFSGDIPGPYKRAAIDRERSAELEQKILSSRFGDYVDKTYTGFGIKEIVKFADILEEMMFLCVEYQLGNHSLGSPVDGMDVRGESGTVFHMVWTRLKEAWKELRPFSGLDDDGFHDAWHQVEDAIFINANSNSRILG